MGSSSVHFHLFSLWSQCGVVCSPNPCTGPSSSPAWDPRAQAALPPLFDLVRRGQYWGSEERVAGFRDTSAVTGVTPHPCGLFLQASWGGVQQGGPEEETSLVRVSDWLFPFLPQPKSCDCESVSGPGQVPWEPCSCSLCPPPLPTVRKQPLNPCEGGVGLGRAEQKA